jgi:hypothetical protein
VFSRLTSEDNDEIDAVGLAALNVAHG